MKKIILHFILLCFLSFVMIQSISLGQYYQPTTSTHPFLIGAFSMGQYKDYAGYNQAHLNLWHIYTSAELNDNFWYPRGWVTIGAPNDYCLRGIGEYIGDVIGILELNANHGMTSLMQRPKIEYLSFGQSSIYQCDTIPDPGHYENTASDWFYSYASHSLGDNHTDGIRIVRRFIADPMNSVPPYVISNLRANRELCNRGSGMYDDGKFIWYILPLIKVPANIEDNTPVCRVEITGWEGNPIKSYELIGNNFKYKSGYYSGDYIDKFRFNLDEDVFEPMYLSQTDAQKINPDRSPKDPNNTDIPCYFDIRVKWYNQSDMYIDYIKVQNNIAYDLLNADINNPNFVRDSIWIQQEAQQIGGHTSGNPYKFYVDEMLYNQLPCIEYVNKKIQSYNNNMSLTCVINSSFFGPTGNNMWIVFSNAKITENIEKVGLRDILIDKYPLLGEKCSMKWFQLHQYIPYSLSTHSYSVPEGFLGVPVPNSVYEDNLQAVLDHPVLFIQGLKTANYASKQLKNLPITFIEQAHLWFGDVGTAYLPGDSCYAQREPSNQELEVMADIAVTYGAKGISYFSYDSWGYFSPDVEGKYKYGRGLLDSSAKYPLGENDTAKRYMNVYGQPKWQKICELNNKLEIWGPYLLQFDNRFSDSYRYYNTEERNLLISTYIKALSTYPSGNPNNCPEIIPNYNIADNSQNCYLQVGVFKTSNTDLENYFMIVNRRCSPGTDPCSGYRRLEIQLGGENNKLDNFNNWKLVNLYDNSTVAVFDKRISNTINLGWYNPGEGKLYKLTPVIP